MIFALKLQARLIAKFFKEEVKKPDNYKRSQTNVTDDSQITAAINSGLNVKFIGRRVDI